MKSLNVFEEKDSNFVEICRTCGGSGRKLKVRTKCCDSLGQRSIKCKACIKGKYKSKNSTWVTCKFCKGTSIFKKVRCKICKGKRNNNNFVSIVCHTCKGKGKFKIMSFNPVITENTKLLLSKPI